MPNQLNSGEIITSIQADLADNNAGLISAYDIRHNMEDIAFSINKIVASGDTETEFPFFNTVKISDVDAVSSTSTTATNGDLIVESGIFFPNAPVNSTDRQDRPWLGEERIDHNNLNNLDAGDVHTQYYHRAGKDAPRAGSNALTGNMETSNVWINSSGIDNVGLKFVQTNPDATEQEIYVSGTMRWANTDNSVLENAKGVAKAWAYFSASGDGNAPEIYSWHNIDSIARKGEAGKLKITFSSGTFENNNFVAIGTSNGTTSSGNLLDMDVNTVSCVARSGDDGNMLRSVTYVIQDEAGQYVDGKVCSFVAYGYSPNETSGVKPTMIDESASPTF